MRRALLSLLALVLFCGGCGHKQAAVAGHSNVVYISVWHSWAGTQKERFAELVKSFNNCHPHIQVRALFTPNDLSTNQKFITAIAAGRPPDVTFVDGQQTAAWAEQGALEPLDRQIAGSHISPGDYFAPSWNQNQYDGHIWALTYCADPNFGFAWNKKVFREAGLDPEKPPTTIEELDRMSNVITKESAGRITRIGIIPWAQFGSANSLFTWGWAFGGEFYDPAGGKITANNPGVVRALEWAANYARKYDVKKLNVFQTGFGTNEQDPFYLGLVAMQCVTVSQIEDIKRYAPNLDYGLTYVPSPKDGEMHSSWVGGWCLALPKGSRHPAAGWEFIRWCCRDPKGTYEVGRCQGMFPGYKASPYFDRVRKQKGYSQFLRILQESRHQRPVMPAQAYFMTSLGRALEFAVYGRKSPREALDDSTVETQTELDMQLGGRKTR